MSIDVCIGNYGYYNEGELRDAWISLPKTSKEISDFLSAHGLQDPEHEEIYISDYDGVPFGLTNLFDEYTHLDDLNMLARQMEARPCAVETVKGALGCGIDEPGSVTGLMNWIEQADKIPYYAYDYTGAYARDEWGQTCIERLSADENYGYTVLEDTDLMRMLEKDSDAMSAFDVERYGRFCSDSGNVQLGDKGYVDGMQDMPDEDRYTREELAEMYPNFVDCTMFGTRAEAVKRYLSKGSKVAIEGKLRYSSWEKDGERRSKIEVIVDEIEFMSRAGRDGQEPVAQSRPSQSVVAAATAQPPMPDLYDEDIPF